MEQFVQCGTQQLNSRILAVSSFALLSSRFAAIKSLLSSFPTHFLFMFSLVRSAIWEGLLQGEPIVWKAARLERGRRSNWPALLGVHGWGNYLPWRHCLPWRATYRMHSCASSRITTWQATTWLVKESLSDHLDLSIYFLRMLNLAKTHKPCWQWLPWCGTCLDYSLVHLIK